MYYEYHHKCPDLSTCELSVIHVQYIQADMYVDIDVDY